MEQFEQENNLVLLGYNLKYETNNHESILIQSPELVNEEKSQISHVKGFQLIYVFHS